MRDGRSGNGLPIQAPPIGQARLSKQSRMTMPRLHSRIAAKPNEAATINNSSVRSLNRKRCGTAFV